MGKKMTISARPIAFFADVRRARALRWMFVAAVLAAVVGAPGAADARKASRAVMVGGGYDGIWNVLIITQAGNCDPAYSYPFQVSGGRITSAGAADVSGTVGRGGGGLVRISAGGAGGSGSGTVGGGHGAARASVVTPPRRRGPTAPAVPVPGRGATAGGRRGPGGVGGRGEGGAAPPET